MSQGFLLLNTLDHVIDQELACREELLTLLLSLLPLVWKIPLQNRPDYTLSSLPEVLIRREGKAFLLRSGREKAVSDAQEFGRSQCQLTESQRCVVRSAHRSQLFASVSDTPADKPISFGDKRHRSPGSTPPVSRQDCRTEAPIAAPPNAETMSGPERLDLQQRLDCELLVEPAALSIFIGMEQSPLDLCHVLLSLLEKVCKFDMSLNHNPGLAISVVPTLTHMLVEFGDCCGPGGSGAEDLAQGWTEEPVALVQRMLLRSILHLMSMGMSQEGDSLPQHLSRNLSDLLQATLKIRSCLERQADPFAPRPKKTLQEVRDDFSFSRNRHQALLLPELLSGVLQVLLGCLQASAPNPFFFSQAVELLHEFLQHRGLALLECAVLRLEQPAVRESAVSGEATGRLSEIIATTLNIVAAIKKTKSEQQHQTVCARQHHGRCQYSQFLHHHHDLSGPPAYASRRAACRNPFQEELADEEAPYPEHCCCLATISQQCLRFLRLLPPNSAPSLQILAGLQAVGICCCMDPSSVVGPLLHLLRLHGPGSPQARVLNLLSLLLLEQLGVGQPAEAANQVACNICTLDSSQLSSLEAALKGGPAINGSSCHSQGVLSSGEVGEGEDLLWKWDTLATYQDLAFSEDRQLSLLMAAHVRQLALRGNPVVCWQLYTHIFSPLLQRGMELAHHAQQLGVSTSCAQACSYHSHCLPIEVLQVYLRTLPALLQSSRVTRALFLSSNGLNQVTELVYLDAARPWALKVFETLILSEAEQRSDALLQDPGPAETGAAERAEGLEGVAGGLISPSSLCKDLREGQRHQSTAVGDTHLSTINLFLRLAFLCVSRDADSDRDSANDSEDTSGYDSPASEPRATRLPRLSRDSLALPSRDQVRRAADVWTTCSGLYLSSGSFQRQFYKLGGLEVCPHLIVLVIQTLASKTRDSRARRREPKERAGPAHADAAEGPDDPPGPDWGEAQARDAPRRQGEEWALESMRLLEALMSICLHSCSTAQYKNKPRLPPQLQSVEEVLAEVRDQLCGLGVVGTDLAIPLFDSLLRVALAQVCSSSEATEEKNALGEEFVPPAGDLSEEAEELQRVGFGSLGGEEGYEADSESDPEYSTCQDQAGEEAELAQVGRSIFGMEAEGRCREELLFPEICIMELRLLSASPPHLEVLLHVLHSLLGVVRKSPHNATLLYQQVSTLPHLLRKTSPLLMGGG
ncbi:hypothetical protein SKAU_G00164830 [Synaphobranchus kaupii]|uniref:Lysosomal-trafficking regulator n=1 Tax=Synaphobranchus kaupii TaxID=118154 RepID=A0A9Q1IZS7_SYNKA|nr:hypothetical protein SKAU_G00164830 [Synaphobranchus kaupii]